jgi:integrase
LVREVPPARRSGPAWTERGRPPAGYVTLVVPHGVFRRAQSVWGLPLNPVAGIEKYRQRASGDIDVFSPEEVLALVRAVGNEQDAAIYLTAAFAGLRRGELLALRWRDVRGSHRSRRSHRAGLVAGALAECPALRSKAGQQTTDVDERGAAMTSPRTRVPPRERVRPRWSGGDQRTTLNAVRPVRDRFDARSVSRALSL